MDEENAAAAAAKSLQSCPTLCDPTDGSSPGSPVPGILQARTLEWVAISFSNAWKWKLKVNLQCRRPRFDSWVGKIRWRRDRTSTPVVLDFPCGSAGKESACNAGDLASICGLGRPPGEGKGHPLQYSCLENSMECIVHEVAKSWTRLSNFHFSYIYCYIQIER